MSVTTDQELELDETEATAESDTDVDVGPTRRPWRRHARLGLVVAVFAGALGTTAVLGWNLWQEHTMTQAAQAARQTAVDYAQVLTSIDSNQVDQNFAAVLSGATGQFKDMYTKASVQLRELLIDNKATAHGVVVESAVQSEAKDKVVVLLMVDQTVTNTGRPDGRVDRTRMKITMEKVDGRWLASKVELP